MSQKVEQEKTSKKGMVTVIICGLISVALIVACVFFPEEFFGLFTK